MSFLTRVSLEPRAVIVPVVLICQKAFHSGETDIYHQMLTSELVGKGNPLLLAAVEKINKDPDNRQNMLVLSYRFDSRILRWYP
jgi:hypothetical protein